MVTGVGKAGAGGVDKVHVTAWHRNSFFINGGAEAADDSFDVLKVQLFISADGL